MTAPTRESYKQRVRRGSRLLDKRYPGWREAIDLTELDLETTTHCILGQLTDKKVINVEDSPVPYVEALDALGVPTDRDGNDDAIRFGFDVSVADSAGLTTRYERLTNEWKKELQAS